MSSAAEAVKARDSMMAAAGGARATDEILAGKSMIVEARGVAPLFPPCYVQQRPLMFYQSHFRGEYVFMEKDGRTWMLSVSLLGDTVWKPTESRYWTRAPKSRGLEYGRPK
jgi:hypothetical protein